MVLGELARVAQAAVLGAAVSVGTSLGLNWMIHQALPAGALVGLGYAIWAIRRDRRRSRAQRRQ